MSSTAAPSTDTGARYRYGVVFLLVFFAVVFIILTPDGAVSRAVAFALVDGALLAVIVTSREPSEVRRRRLVIGGCLAVLITIGIAVGLIGHGAAFALIALVTLILPVSLSRGLLRLVRERGVTLQAVAGALAIYLLIGLAFASVIGFVADIGPPGFYAETTKATASSNVYYSFTVMTTTGFGDLTAAHHVGRAMAVIEMLIGQLYLVTVIGIVIGRRVGQSG
ncbi:MAG: two pore domain potassium channel family protein [Solirubrobacterales bacterium]|nr:two pore domain potassium channel family protein [Solirubrobacterales bacterium]